MPFDATDFSVTLTRWFNRAQRDLPWRRAENARDPYRILVSEVMLQQTTVAAVIPFYHRFLERFPTLQSLAEATIEDVLPLWAGLGYYSRARNLHAMAQAVVERHDGVFPRELADVLALPGVGRYTAGAVTSIAYDSLSPIVDANVARLFARLFLIEGDLKTTANQTRLWHEATRLVQACSGDCKPSILNPALMELGALICTPRSPRCEACPVAAYCAARTAGRQDELPHQKAKTAPVELQDACIFVRAENFSEEGAPAERGAFQKVLLRRRSHEAKVWWRGMWELPRITARENETTAEAAARLLREEFGCDDCDFTVGAKLKTVTHGVTHHRITLDCYEVQLQPESVSGALEGMNGAWVSWDEIDELALPSSMSTLLRWLLKHESSGNRLDSSQPALW